MVHNNYINNPNLYSNSSTYHEFSAHSFRGSRLANEEARLGTVASRVGIQAMFPIHQGALRRLTSVSIAVAL